MSKPQTTANPSVTDTARWVRNNKARRQRLAKEGGGQYFALLDGDYMGKVEEILAWRTPAWRKNHGRAINKTDLLKLMIDADYAQIKRRQRATARRTDPADDPTS